MKTTTIFCLSKSHQNMRGYINFPSKFYQKIHQNDVDLPSIEKKQGNDVCILLIKVTPNKVRRNDVDFSLILITLKKVRRNDVDFLPMEVTSRKYVKMTWKFIDIFFSTHRHNIDFKLTSIRRDASGAKSP